jgi:hypothetical protein
VPIRIYLGLVYFVDTLMVYVLMLIVMTFNGWVVLSLVLGLTIGYSFEKVKLDYACMSKDKCVEATSCH